MKKPAAMRPTKRTMTVRSVYLAAFEPWRAGRAGETAGRGFGADGAPAGRSLEVPTLAVPTLAVGGRRTPLGGFRTGAGGGAAGSEGGGSGAGVNPAASSLKKSGSSAFPWVSSGIDHFSSPIRTRAIFF